MPSILFRDVLLLRLARDLVRPELLVDEKQFLLEFFCEEKSVEVEFLYCAFASLLFLLERQDVGFDKAEHGFIPRQFFKRYDISLIISVKDRLSLDCLRQKEECLMNCVNCESLSLRFCLIKEDSKIIE